MTLLAVPASAFGFEPLATFGSNGTAPGQISQARGIAIGPDGLAYLADSANNRVDVFSPTGAFARSLGKAAIPLAGEEECKVDSNCHNDGSGAAGVMSGPRDLALDSAGNVFVADYGNNRVDVFSAQGSYIRSIGKAVTLPAGDECKVDSNCVGNGEVESAGAMNSPYDVAVDANGQVAVADYKNLRIDVFSAQGGFIRAFGKAVNPSGGDICTAATGCKKGTESGAAGGLVLPDALTVSDTGGLYVADAQNHRIDEFGFDGTFVRAFGEGVVSGAPAFEVCSTASGCRAGIASANPGSVPNPRGTATDCTGAIYAVELIPESKPDGSTSRVARFGEPASANPPCPKAALAASVSGSGSTSPASALPDIAGRPRTAKPSIKVELNKGSGTANLVVIVSDPGTLLLKGKGIRKVKRQAKRPGLIELLMAPKGATKRKLEETGKAAVKLSLTFNADNGASDTQTKSVGLKMVAPL